jgi:hypothetical protein
MKFVLAQPAVESAYQALLVIERNEFPVGRQV